MKRYIIGIMSVVCLEKFEEVRRGVGVLTAGDVVERAGPLRPSRPLDAPC